MDRFEQLQAFVQVVNRGSFTGAGAELRVSQSTISKWVSGLERELGVRLLDRTTRSQRVTPSGQRFYERAVAILELHDAALGELQQGEASVSGRIRVSLPAVFGRRHLLPLLAEFLERHVEVELELSLLDRYVSLVEEGFDLAVRVGRPLDSALRSHALGDAERRLVAAPAYIAEHGAPSSAADLERHQCLVHWEGSRRASWDFGEGGKRHRIFPTGRVKVNSSEAVLALALRGFGIAQLASWLVDEELAAGRLVHVLPQLELAPAPIRALTSPGGPPPFRVRVLIDHLREGLKRRAVCPAGSVSALRR